MKKVKSGCLFTESIEKEILPVVRNVSVLSNVSDGRKYLSAIESFS